MRASTAAIVGAVALHGCAHTKESTIVATIHEIGRGADERRWDAVRAAFAPRVVLGYGAPELLTPEQIVDRWRPLLSAFDRTQHVMRDERVDLVEPARARVQALFQATHHLRGAPGGELWTLDGRYEYELVRDASGAWKVSRMRMIPGASTGNGRLIELARERAGLPAPPPATVQVQRVSFDVEGQRVVGNLYLPAKPAGRLPAVAVFGTWTSTKEMIVPGYARPLAEHGFAALVIDFRGFGESDGSERRSESPARKIRDIRAAVDFLAAHPGVDPQRIALVGVCVAASYVAGEAGGDPRVRSVALVAPWLHDAAIVEEVYGGAAGVAERRRLGAEARRRFEQSGEITYVPAASSSDPRAAMHWEGDVLDYYLNPRRGGIPQWGNQFAVMAWPEWLSFDGVATAKRLRQPALIVHAETAAIPQGARAFAAALPAPPRQVWLEGPTQFDFYDRPEVVARAADEVLRHLRETLAGDARDANRRVVRAFFERLEAFDIEGFAALFAEDGRQLMPYAPEGFPRELVGRAAVLNQYRGMPQNFTAMRFPDLVIHDMLDAARFVVTFRGEIALRTGGTYDNTYLGIFVVRDGKIAEYTEYFDPTILVRAFGGALQKSFNVKP